jgi:DNA-binding SARP family transcriptional activator
MPRPRRAAQGEHKPLSTRGRVAKAVRVSLLGSFRVSVGGHVVEESEWQLRRAASLVKLLSLAPAHQLHRGQVMEILWPGSGRRAAGHNLRQALHVARRALESDPSTPHYLVSHGEHLVLCPDGLLWVDVEAFEEAAATARHSREPRAYQVAIGLYAGELLPEDRYEDWAEERRAELRTLYLTLLWEVAEVHEADGNRSFRCS